MDELALALSQDVVGAFPALVGHMGRRLYWGLRRMSGDHGEAEDLTQETLIRAYKALLGYDRRRIEELRVEPWLWTIAMNLGRNSLRDRSRRPTFVPEVDGRTEDPDLFDDEAWNRRMAVLNANQRAAVVMRHVVGLSTKEIAEALGRPEGTVKADVYRGLEKLRRAMEEES